MRKIRELLRLRWEQHLPQRRISQSLGLSQGSVSDYLNRARRAGLTWPLPDALDDAGLEALLFPPPCSDAETHRVVMPDQPDHGLQCRLDTAIATELVANGVELAVQVVDKAAYVNWLGGLQSNSEWRAAYRDRGRLVRGEAALELLGVPPGAARPRPKRPASRQRKGTPAERLVRAWLDDDPEFDMLLGVLLDEGRQGVVDMAIRKVAADYVDEEAEDLKITLLEVAEAAEVEPGTWAALFVVAVIIDPEIDTLPEPVPIADGIKTSGHFVAGRDVVIVPA